MIDKLSKTSRFFQFALALLVIFLSVYMLIVGRAIILPFMIGLFLTFIFDPVVRIQMRVKIPHGLAVTFTLIISFVLLYLFGLLVYSNAQTFVAQFPTYEERLVGLIKGVIGWLEEISGQNITVDVWQKINWFDTIQSFSIASNVVAGLGTFFGFFVKMLFVILVMAYMLVGMKNLNVKINKAFPGERAREIDSVLRTVISKIQAYLGTKIIVSFITAIIALIIFWSFGLDFAVFWAFIIFLFNFIPNIGSIIASALPVVFSILQFGTFSTAFWILMAMVILQFLMGNIVEPRLMGYSLDLSPLMVIISLVFWGYIWGIAGMFLSVPILATIAIVCERIDSLKFISVFLRSKV